MVKKNLLHDGDASKINFFILGDLNLLLDVSEDGFDHWDVWVLGRRIEIFSALVVEADPLCSE